MMCQSDDQTNDKDLVSFDNLPDELIILIFSHLNPEELACCVSKVCLRWLDISKDAVLWEKAVLSYNDLNSVEFQDTIQFAPCLAKLKINMFKFLNEDTIHSILTGCKFVKYFSFYPNNNVPAEQNLSILNHYQTSLEELNMYVEESYLCNGSSKSFIEMLSNFANLKVLTLVGIMKFFPNIEPYRNGFKSLEALDVSELIVQDERSINQMHTFIFCILEHQGKTLKKLSLPQKPSNCFQGKMMETKFVAPVLENIKISEISLGAVKNLSCLKVLNVIGVSLKDLQTLKMRNLPLSCQYTSMFDWIKDTPQFLNLTELILENIIDDERNLISKLINASRNLESFTISSGCPTVAQLSFIISNLPPLKILSIHRMPCLRAKHLELLTLHMPDLKLLNLRYNSLSDGILKYYKDHMQRKMEDLQLVCDWGFWNKHGGKSWVKHHQTMEIYSNPTTQELHAQSVISSSPSSNFTSVDREKIKMLLNEINDYEDDD